MLFSHTLGLWLTCAALQADARLQIPFEKYTLPENGLEVILSVDHSLPLVAVNTWYHAGPINEPPRRTGFAHLFEHLMFQGSSHVADDEHFKLLEASGASLINGSTGFDRTNYYETLPANELDLALWLESDRMGFLLGGLTQKTLDNQRQVVMNERRQTIENAPYGPSSEALVQALFAPEHPYYGYVIGSMKDLSAATLDDVQEFYTRFYAPANATLVVAGDFDAEAVKQRIAHYFGSLARRDAPTSRAVTTPALAGVRRVEKKEHVALPQLQLAWLTPPAYQAHDADLDVLATILAGGEASRLHRQLVYVQQLAQDVAASQDSEALTSMFTITLTGRRDTDMHALEAKADIVLDSLRKAPAAMDEVRRARNQIKTHLISQLQRIGARAEMLNRYNQYTGDPGYLAADFARYDAVTPESVQRAAKTFLRPDARVVVSTVPEP